MHFKISPFALFIICLSYGCNKESYIEGYGTITDSMANNGQSNVKGTFTATINGVNPGNWKLLSGAGASAGTDTTIIIEGNYNNAGSFIWYSNSANFIVIRISAVGYSTDTAAYVSSSPIIERGELTITSYDPSSKVASGSFYGTALGLNSTNKNVPVTFSGSFTNMTLP